MNLFLFKASVIHEILYLDSQFDQCQLNSHDQTNNEVEMTEGEQTHEQNGSSLITNDTTSSKGQQSSLTDVTRLRMSMTDTSDLNVKSTSAVAESPRNGPVASDLITDDERDANTSY